MPSEESVPAADQVASRSPGESLDVMPTRDRVRAVRAGNDEEFGELVSVHRHRFRRAAMARTRCVDDAEDAVSDAVLATLLLLRQGRPEVGPSDDAGFPGYLIQTIRHRASTATAQERRRHRLAEHAFHDPTVPPCVSGRIPDQRPGDPSHTVDRAAPWAAFAALPPRQRRALELTVLEQRPVSEAAAALRLRSPAFIALAYRARTNLRRIYHDTTPGPATHDA